MLGPERRVALDRVEALARAARGLERALTRHAVPLLLAIVLGATAVRLAGWGVWWSNPDEGMQFAAATAPSAELLGHLESNAHPPLSFLVSRGIASAGGGIDAMRVPALIAGVLLVPLVFQVARRWGGPAAGVTAALLVANASGPVMLSQVVRPYMPQAACLAIAVLALFRILERPGPAAGVVFALGFCTALLLHYSSYVALAGAVLYLGVLAALRQLSRRHVVVLVAALIPVTLLGIALYAAHVASLQGSEMQAEALEGWLQESFTSGPQSLIANVWRAARYLIGAPAAFAIPPLVAAAPFLHPAGVRFRPSLLAVTTLACAALFSGLGQYPLGPTRHSTYLLVVMAPAAGVAIAGLLRSRGPWLALAGLAAFALVLAGALLGRREGLSERPLRRAQAEALLAHLDRVSKPGDWILLDSETYWLLTPRFGPPLAPSHGGSLPSQFEVGARRYAVSSVWRLQVRDGRDDLLDLIEALGVAGDGELGTWAGRRTWLLQGGWDPPLVPRLLPERTEDGRRLRGPVLGSKGLVLARLYPEVYRDWAARRVEAAGGVRRSPAGSATALPGPFLLAVELEVASARLAASRRGLAVVGAVGERLVVAPVRVVAGRAAGAVARVDGGAELCERAAEAVDLRRGLAPEAGIRGVAHSVGIRIREGRRERGLDAREARLRGSQLGLRRGEVSLCQRELCTEARSVGGRRGQIGLAGRQPVAEFTQLGCDRPVGEDARGLALPRLFEIGGALGELRRDAAPVGASQHEQRELQGDRAALRVVERQRIEPQRDRVHHRSGEVGAHVDRVLEEA